MPTVDVSSRLVAIAFTVSFADPIGPRSRAPNKVGIRRRTIPVLQCEGRDCSSLGPGWVPGIVALVGFYDTLRLAGPVMILAPILGAVGLTLVTISHLIPIAMGYELVPAYIPQTRQDSTLAATADTLRRHRPGDQRCRQLPRPRRRGSAVRGGDPDHPRCRGGSDGLACSSGRSPDGWGYSARVPR